MSHKYERRPVSLGGYGTVIPYHGIDNYDPSQGEESNIIRLPVGQGWVSPEEILEFFDRLESTVEARTQRGELYYSYLCMDYGFHGSGRDDFQEDLRSSFDLKDQLKATLEEQYNVELESHRPCFVSLFPVNGGFAYLLLRGGKSTESNNAEPEIKYDTEAGVVMSQRLLEWPNVRDLLPGNNGGPIPQETTHVEIASLRATEIELEKVVPVDQERTGDADIISANNPFDPRHVDTNDDEIKDALENTQRLTFRVAGGTVGFDNEERYTVDSLTIYKVENISFWGFPFVFAKPICSAHTS